jgi:hypothetical protein
MRKDASSRIAGICSANLTILFALLLFVGLGNGEGFGQVANSISNPSINNVTNAAYYAGSDCGSKVMAADAAWAGTPVEIDITQACGTSIATAITPSPGHMLNFTQPGTYTELIRFPDMGPRSIWPTPELRCRAFQA